MPFIDHMLDKLEVKGCIVFLMAIPDTTRSLSPRKTKKRPYLLALMGLFQSKGFHLGCLISWRPDIVVYVDIFLYG